MFQVARAIPEVNTDWGVVGRGIQRGLWLSLPGDRRETRAAEKGIWQSLRVLGQMAEHLAAIIFIQPDHVFNQLCQQHL